MTEENKELEFDEAQDLPKKKTPQGYDVYTNLEISRVNIRAKEVEGIYVNKVGETKSKLIDSIVKALGTMVQEPEFTSDPSNIGQKTFKMYIQRPILEGDNRKQVIDKLVEIITTV